MSNGNGGGFQKNPDEIGALWIKSGAKGEFMTGEVTIDGKVTKIVVFPTNANNNRAPAWRILKSRDNGSQRQQRNDSGPAPDGFERGGYPRGFGNDDF